MKIRKLTLAPFRLPLREPIATAAGRIETREGVLVSMHANAALVGYGEATPIAGFATESFGQVWDTLIELAPQLVGEDIRDLEALLDGIEAAAPAAPAARAALDTALHDLAARSMVRGLASWLCEREARFPRPRVPVNALLVSREPSELAREARAAVRAGFRTLKLKVAADPLTRDVARVAAVRAASPSGVRLRLDANGGWKEEEALAALQRLVSFDVEMVEQPVDANDLLALARVRAASPVRVVADESAAGVSRALRVISLRAADAICIKLGPAGGLRAARRLAARARAASIDVFVTSGIDGAVARCAALQLAATLSEPMPACGLATGALLADDIAALSPPVRGSLALPLATGLGIDPDPRALSRVASGPSIEFVDGGA
jgi:o-succinylbenzoate synthase